MYFAIDFSIRRYRPQFIRLWQTKSQFRNLHRGFRFFRYPADEAMRVTGTSLRWNCYIAANRQLIFIRNSTGNLVDEKSTGMRSRMFENTKRKYCLIQQIEYDGSSPLPRNGRRNSEDVQKKKSERGSLLG